MNTYIQTGLKKFPTQFATVSFKDGKPVYKQSDAKRTDRFTYKAYIEKIIDGDTLWVIWDAGFSMLLRQKVRLRGIEAPEIDTQEGKIVRQYVLDTLKGLPFVIIKSKTRDKFDRPLVDLYYIKGTEDAQTVLEKGIYLNQELLNKELVSIYEA